MTQVTLAFPTPPAIYYADQTIAEIESMPPPVIPEGTTELDVFGQPLSKITLTDKEKLLFEIHDQADFSTLLLDAFWI